MAGKEIVRERMSLEEAFKIVLHLASEAKDAFVEEVHDQVCELEGIDPMDPPDDIETLFHEEDIEVIEENEAAWMVVEDFVMKARMRKMDMIEAKMGVAK